ncbi:hypothetical protein [Breznakiella homolactica]|uniref:Uncharacterized protein n=1 Tax=Breznakiella homolactica TaxID=2798577 RepID=A0A7T7XM56_9SPIR|nr:hypothetical protein [Breznakiella homolactica]QQO08904.1 hypothetical protein JFL75_18535 [Breznakiella homolactica]
MHRIQITLTPAEAKRIIAKAIAALPEVRDALAQGAIFLKGGSTASAVAEEFGFPALHLSGRISPRGTLGAAVSPDIPHNGLIRNGSLVSADDDTVTIVRNLGRGDIIITGANAVDSEGNAAMMAGAEGGGNPGAAWGAFSTEGASVIIAAGTEKLIPGSIRDAVSAAGRKGVDVSTGMAVGLLPVFGRLITEREALEILAPVRATVIGAGGITGGEGSSVIVIEGEQFDTRKVFDLVLSIKGTELSGAAESAGECRGPNSRCGLHRSCIYAQGGG